MKPLATARRNGSFGYKAVVQWKGARPGGSDRTHIPVRKNWPTREAAIAYAEKWIAANYK